MFELNPNLQHLIKSELDSGERVEWHAQPRPGRFVLMSLPIVLFGIPWTLFSLIWMWGASGFGDSSEAAPTAFSLFGLPFVFIGFGMLSSPFWMLRKAWRTVYVITDRRAILFEGGFRGVGIRSFGPERLSDLRRKQRADGSGDVIFERHVRYDSDGDRRSTDIGFFGVENVKAVEDRLRQLATEAQTSSSGDHSN
jgi:hypothetical protein